MAQSTYFMNLFYVEEMILQEATAQINPHAEQGDEMRLI
jgi:hypothetical protein